MSDYVTKCDARLDGNVEFSAGVLAVPFIARAYKNITFITYINSYLTHLFNKKIGLDIRPNPIFSLNIVLATSYLPGQWPAEYFRLNESFRPCSGWEREFSSRFVTSDSVFAVVIHDQPHHTLKVA